jgi:2-polyprenyl-3-methyl-5-hydroxy-6-metoxy-1,4-benzoquinol methylase
MNINRLLKTLINGIGMRYVQMVCAREYNNQIFRGVNERPIEFAFVFRQLVACWPKNILDVGTGMTSLPHLMRNCGFHVTATDNIKDYWPMGMVNRHYHIVNDDITHSTLKATHDVITCISVLEHIQEHREAIKTMYRLLAPGGRLILTCPYNEYQYVQNVYTLPESSVTEKFPFVTQSFSRQELNAWLDDSPFELLEQEYWHFFDGKFWTCGEKIIPPQRVGVGESHQLTCLLLAKPK